MKITILKLCLFAGLTTLIFHDTGIGGSVGTSGGQMLSLRTSAKQESTAGAMTASGDDTSAMSINSAAIGRIKYPEAMFSQAVLFEDIKFSYLAYAHPTRIGNLGFDYMNLSYGEFETTDRSRTKTGTQSPKDTYVGVTYATNEKASRLGSLRLGGTARYLKSSLADHSASAFSMNLGAAYETKIPRLRVGLAANNLGSGMKYANESSPLPRSIRLGFSYTTREISWLGGTIGGAVDGVIPRDGQTHFASSSEIRFLRNLAIQFGYSGEEGLGQQIRYGFELGIKALTFNYAVAPFEDLGLTHRMSVRMRFDRELWKIHKYLSRDHYEEEDVNQAKDHLERKDPEQAYYFATKVLKKNPENKDALQIMETLERNQKSEMAQEIFSEAVVLANAGKISESFESISQCVELDEQNKRYSEMRDQLRELIQRDLAKVEIQKQRQVLFVIQNEFTKVADRGLPQEPQMREAMQEAVLALDRGDVTAAAERVGTARQLINEMAAAQAAMLTQLPAVSGEYAISTATIHDAEKTVAAEKEIESPEKEESTHKTQVSAWKLKPTAASIADNAGMRADYDKAVYYMNNRQIDEALRLLRNLYELNKNYEDVPKRMVACLQSRIVSLYANRHYSLALKDIQEGLKIDPQNKRLKTFKANTETMLRNYEELRGAGRP